MVNKEAGLLRREATGTLSIRYGLEKFSLKRKIKRKRKKALMIIKYPILTTSNALI